jgi:pimeloyl-ACP methyl ester carboxylesterase
VTAVRDRVRARGIDLAVEVVGDRGPMFVWGHGLTSSRASEDESGLLTWHDGEDEAWRWARFDARGHGESDGTAESECYRWDALAGDMLAVADHAGVDRFVVGGASMGCASALYAALGAPQRIDALVLVIPPTAWATRVAQRQIYLDSAAFVEQRGKQAWLDGRAALPRPQIFAGEPEQPITAAVDEQLLPSVLRGAAASDLPAIDRLKSITQPALILAWDTDPVHPVSTAETLAGVLPSCELHVARRLDDLRRWPQLVAGHVAAAGYN